MTKEIMFKVIKDNQPASFADYQRDLVESYKKTIEAEIAGCGPNKTEFTYAHFCTANVIEDNGRANVVVTHFNEDDKEQIITELKLNKYSLEEIL